MTAGLGELVVALMMSGQTHPAAHWHDDETHARLAVAHQGADERDTGAAGCALPPHDVWLIDQYYGEHARPAMLGLSRKLERSGRLPYDWERRLEPFPVMVDRQLAALPPGARRGVLDGYAVVYRPDTETVVDAVALFRLR